MMIRVLTFLCCFILLVACNTKEEPKKPENLIPKEKMEKILYDLFVINAAKGVNRKLLEVNGISPERYILTKHKIDSIQFAESNSYYAYDKERYRGIVENVKKRIEKEKVVFDKLQKKEDEKKKRKRDSIREANKNKNKDSIKIPKKIPKKFG